MLNASPKGPPLIIRCLIMGSPNSWQAFTLEFGLAVQASSEDEAKSKLESMIEHYLYDALVGEDREHAIELLSRRAVPSVYFRYHMANLLSKFPPFGNGRSGNRIYEEPVSLVPAACMV